MIGNLRERVEILRPMRTPDEGGGYAITYTSLGTVAAETESRRPLTDRSAVYPIRRRRKRFLIRNRDDLIFEMRFVHQGRQYRITDIQDQDQSGRFTILEGEEAVA